MNDRNLTRMVGGPQIIVFDEGKVLFSSIFTMRVLPDSIYMVAETGSDRAMGIRQTLCRSSWDATRITENLEAGVV